MPITTTSTTSSWRSVLDDVARNTVNEAPRAKGEVGSLLAACECKSALTKVVVVVAAVLAQLPSCAFLKIWSPLVSCSTSVHLVRKVFTQSRRSVYLEVAGFVQVKCGDLSVHSME